MSPTIEPMPDGRPQAFPPPDPAATRQLPVVEPPDVDRTVEELAPSRRRSPFMVALEIFFVGLLLMFGIGFIDRAVRGDTPRRTGTPAEPDVTTALLVGSTIVLAEDPYTAAQRTAEAFLALVAADQFEPAAASTAGAGQNGETLAKWYGGDRTLAPAIVSIDQTGPNRFSVRVVFVSTDPRAENELPEVRCGRFDVDPTTALMQAYQPIMLTDSSLLQEAAPLERAKQLCAQARLVA